MDIGTWYSIVDPSFNLVTIIPSNIIHAGHAMYLLDLVLYMQPIDTGTD